MNRMESILSDQQLKMSKSVSSRVQRAFSNTSRQLTDDEIATLINNLVASHTCPLSRLLLDSTNQQTDTSLTSSSHTNSSASPSAAVAVAVMPVLCLQQMDALLDGSWLTCILNNKGTQKYVVGVVNTMGLVKPTPPSTPKSQPPNEALVATTSSNVNININNTPQPGSTISPAAQVNTRSSKRGRRSTASRGDVEADSESSIEFGAHWITLLVDVKKSKVLIVDSMSDNGTDHQIQCSSCNMWRVVSYSAYKEYHSVVAACKKAKLGHGGAVSNKSVQSANDEQEVDWLCEQDGYVCLQERYLGQDESTYASITQNLFDCFIKRTYEVSCMQLGLQTELYNCGVWAVSVIQCFLQHGCDIDGVRLAWFNQTGFVKQQRQLFSAMLYPD